MVRVDQSLARSSTVLVDLLEGGVRVDVPGIGDDGVLVLRVVVVDESHNRFGAAWFDGLQVADVVRVETEYEIELDEIVGLDLRS